MLERGENKLDNKELKRREKEERFSKKKANEVRGRGDGTGKEVSELERVKKRRPTNFFNHPLFSYTSPRHREKMDKLLLR